MLCSSDYPGRDVPGEKSTRDRAPEPSGPLNSASGEHYVLHDGYRSAVRGNSLNKGNMSSQRRKMLPVTHSFADRDCQRIMPPAVCLKLQWRHSRLRRSPPRSPQVKQRTVRSFDLNPYRTSSLWRTWVYARLRVTLCGSAKVGVRDGRTAPAQSSLDENAFSGTSNMFGCVHLPDG